MRGVGARLIEERVREMLGLVQLEGMENRSIREISGGQSQRVALARALIVEPRVWLLDEPLSQLDANLREEMRELICSIQRHLGVTTLFVTHDQEEAVVMADRIGLVLDGRLRQIGPPTELLERPATVEVATFFGGHNQIPGEVRGDWFDCQLGRFRLASPVAPGPRVMIIRREAVELGRAENSVEAIVDSTRYMGTHLRVELSVAGTTVLANTSSGQVIEPGSRVWVRFPPDRIWTVPPSDCNGAGTDRG